MERLGRIGGASAKVAGFGRLTSGRQTFGWTEETYRTREIEGEATGCRTREGCVEGVGLLLQTVLGC